MKTYVYSLLITALVFGSCRTTKAITEQEQKLYDVAYGSHERNIMDVFLPAGRTPQTPFVILIHGGAWVKAGKENIREYQDTLLNNGFAVASINHRYANDSDVHYMQMLEDVDQAVSYCLAHAKQWNTRKSDVVMTGGSSGGHLAMLYGFTTSKKIKAIVDFSGPTSLADTVTLNYTIKANLVDLVQKMTGSIYHPGQPLDTAFALSSPITHVSNIPVLIIHGDADPVVPYRQAELLESRLREKGFPHKLVTVPGAGHDLNLKDAATRAWIYSEAVQWIRRYGN